MKNKIKQFEILNEEIREYLYPKLYILLIQGKLNKGKYPDHMKPENIVTIREFSIDSNENITVEYDIYWGHGSYDYSSITLSNEEWEKI